MNSEDNRFLKSQGKTSDKLFHRNGGVNCTRERTIGYYICLKVFFMVYVNRNYDNKLFYDPELSSQNIL